MVNKKCTKVFSVILTAVILISMMIVATPGATFAASTTYYVDAVSGNDVNNGTSTSAAWKTLDKVSSVTFQPGDRILFKAGCTWTGALKVKGSGTSASRIVIDMYGTGAKPLLMPGADWVENKTSAGGGFVTNEPTNNLITLKNVNYWEINNLELYDSKFDSINPATTTVFRRGVYIVAEDIGAMNHIYLKNLYIHGFRGPNSNQGKDSGGIIYHVNTNPTNPSARVISWFNDMLVQDCVIEKVGRSGINFASPWIGRTPTNGRWNTFPYAGLGQWTPNTNVVIRNNTFNDIDGDGTIIDNCDGAIFEYNTVARALSNSAFAAGVFPWNSDNTVIQYNDLYSTKAGADAEGVEIDALNYNTMVQYNYSHDNKGGFVEFCTYDEFVSYDGTYRYNISQNDWDGYGVLNVSSKSYNSKVYNNTVYMGAGTRTFLKTPYVTEAGQIQLYNNIFYNAGTLNAIDWKTNMIDWSNNVYYNFPSTPSNDTAKLTSNPMFVQPGSGTIGINTVAGYKLYSGSPAINSGKIIANNGGRDYFGNSLYNGAPDRGAHEFSNDTPVLNIIPQSQMTATATSFEPVDAPSNALDGNPNTLWHTKWDSSNPLPQSITLNLGGTYTIDKIKYLPRQDSNTNGIITGYNIYTSTNGTTFTKVTTGTWANDKTEKTGAFTATSAAYVKLEATAGTGGWAAAAELNVYTQSAAQTTYVSDMTWTSATNGWGPVEKNMSNGEQATGDGLTITLNGVTYAKGLGTHANSTVVYNISGLGYTRFVSDVGVDDEMTGTMASLVFQVYLDNVKVYDSGTMGTTTATKTIDLSVTGKSELKLVVTDSGNGNGNDHGDWAGARLIK